MIFRVAILSPYCGVIQVHIHTRAQRDKRFLPLSSSSLLLLITYQAWKNWQDTPKFHNHLPSSSILGLPRSSSSLPCSLRPSSHSSSDPPISLCQLIKLDLSHSAKRKLNPQPRTPSVASAPSLFLTPLFPIHVTKSVTVNYAYVVCVALLLCLLLIRNHNA